MSRSKGGFEAHSMGIRMRVLAGGQCEVHLDVRARFSHAVGCIVVDQATLSRLQDAARDLLGTARLVPVETKVNP